MPGTALPIAKARLEIGSVAESVAVASTDKAATFRVRMETGAAELKTWFLAEDKSEWGACYEYVSGPG